MVIKYLTRSADVSAFIRQLIPLLNTDTIHINFDNKKTLPAACVPVSGIIDTLREEGKEIITHYSPDSYLANIHFNHPYKVNEHDDSLAFPFSKIWKFNEYDEVKKLVDAYLEEIASIIPCSSGLIEGLIWSLNETMDNVLQHSNCGTGYMMGVVHRTNNCILFSIFDNGQGIFNSLRNSEYHPRTAIDAISLSVQEGKTRDKNIGQGNGLWGLNNIILSNHGRLEITSHGSSLVMYNNGTTNKYEELPYLNANHPSTTINISFNYENEISVSEALGGYIPLDIKYDDKIDEDNQLIFELSKETTGFGTRIAGERLRNKVLNYFKRIDPPSRIVLDFSGVSMISSSFADEFIGKIISEVGFFRFTKLFSICGVSPTIEPIINRSVSQRMATLFPAES